MASATSDYQMKIYSQIKSPADHPQQSDPIRTSHFSFHNSAAQSNDPIRTQISDSSLRNQKSKFSFRLQPELYFQKNNPQIEKIYHAPSHIRLANSSSESSLQELSQNLKITQNRKKIFDDSMRITVLNEAGQKVEQLESKLPQPTLQPVQAPKAQDDKKTLAGILKRNIQVEQHNQLNNNSSFQSNRDKSRKGLQKVQFVHQNTDKYLTKPILQEQTYRPSIKKTQITSSQFPNNYSALAEKIESNEKRLIELNQKLNKKIDEDNRRNEYFMRMLSQNTHKHQQKILEKQNEERQMRRVATQRAYQKQRINLQIQQSKRMQQLILQNRYLCAKVLKQSSHKCRASPSPDEIQIDQRIKELQKMRQNMQPNRTFTQSQSLHLNDSIGHSPHLNITANQHPPTTQERSHSQVGNSTITVKQWPYPHQGSPTFYTPAVRDVPAASAQVKRIVLVSKIY